MSNSRRFALIGLIATMGIAIAGAAVGMVVVRAYGSSAAAATGLRKIIAGCPKVVVEQTQFELGVIDKPDEFTHEYVFHNEGNAPLALARGPSTCSCTLTGLPEKPIPPGGKGIVSIGFNESHKDDVLKPGPLDRGVTVFTNDPDNEKILLGLIATVRRRMAVNPSPLVFAIHATGQEADKPHIASATIYSQTYDRFELSAGRCSLSGVTWKIEPASKEELKLCEAQCGYRVNVALPPDMPDGRISGRIDFDARPNTAEKQSISLEIQGAVDGHLSMFGQKLETGHRGSKILLWGSLPAGQAAKENVLLKINSEPKTFRVEHLETEPAFLHARVVPVGEGSEKNGVYRIEVEIPRDASPCNFMQEGHLGVVRLKTDHPRFPTIELKVLFAVVRGK